MRESPLPKGVRGGCVIPFRVLVLAVVVLAAWAPHVTGESPVVDGHSHEGLRFNHGAIDTSGLDGLTARGIEVVVHALPVDRGKTTDVEARIAGEVEWLRKAAAVSNFAVLDQPIDALSGVPEGEIRLVFTIEWFGSIFGSDPASVSRYGDVGVRMIGLVEDDPDGLFSENDTATLSPYGRRIIEAMNDAGIVIDITHLSHEQMIEVINASSAPVVASHSNARAVTASRWNLPEEVIGALAEHDGAVWISFNEKEVVGYDATGVDAVNRLVDHIDYLVNRLGADDVGIGTDLQAGGTYVPAALNTDQSFAAIRRGLEERNYPAETVDGILGANVLRALARSP